MNYYQLVKDLIDTGRDSRLGLETPVFAQIIAADGRYLFPINSVGDHIINEDGEVKWTSIDLECDIESDNPGFPMSLGQLIVELAERFEECVREYNEPWTPRILAGDYSDVATVKLNADSGRIEIVSTNE